MASADSCVRALGSIKQRVDLVEAQGKTAELEAAGGGSVAGSQAAAGLEESLWLCPIEDRRGLDSCREGMIEGFSLGSCVKLAEVQPLLPPYLNDQRTACHFCVFLLRNPMTPTSKDFLSGLSGQRISI